jgi:hypothetical protein
MFLINGKIANTYPRQDIKEKVIGCKHVIYKIVDNIPVYDSKLQRIIKSDIKTTDELYNNLDHIKIAYQNYLVEDIKDRVLKEQFENEFGIWLDNEYPIWKRLKHSTEISRRISKDKIDKAKEWQDWEFEQRRILEEEILNKTYNFNFYPKQ